jgi:aminoglycoside phosphotransferase (APT) family kinase protein
MNDIDNIPSQNAIRASCQIAKEQGLKFDEAVILREQSNLIIHLRPTPVIARVATTTATFRTGDAWLAREVAVARHLASVGAPVVSPSHLVDPGPHHHNGLVLSFWEFVEELPEPVDPATAGRTLRECHEALIDFNGELSILEPISESQQIFSQLLRQGAFSSADADMLQRINERLNKKLNQLNLQKNLTMQPLHGDSNFSNVLNTTRGVLWIDWEDTFLGPVVWDIACLIASSRVFGTDTDKASAAIVGYGKTIDNELLDLFVEIRTFQTVLWNYIIGQKYPESLERLNVRLRWFRSRKNN